MWFDETARMRSRYISFWLRSLCIVFLEMLRLCRVKISHLEVLGVVPLVYLRYFECVLVLGLPSTGDFGEVIAYDLLKLCCCRIWQLSCWKLNWEKLALFYAFSDHPNRLEVKSVFGFSFSARVCWTARIKLSFLLGLVLWRHLECLCAPCLDW